jgi:ABC-2 type transport system ATP-binding protein
VGAPAISVQGVSKRFRLFHERPTSVKEGVLRFRRSRAEDFWALHDVSAEIPDGQTVGLLGANGSGKTTLLKIIGGILRPTEGRVVTRGRIAALLELGAGFHPELTGRENVYLNASILGLSKKETDRHFDEIVGFAELEEFIDNQVKFYSSGMFVRLGFAVAVHVDPHILLVDEVLAVGDEAFQRKCINRVREFQQEGRTIVFVTHAVPLVQRICDQAVLLDHGRVRAAGEVDGVIKDFRLAMVRVAEAPSDDSGTKEAEVRGVQILDGQGRPTSVISPGEPLTVQVEFETHRELDNPVVSIILHNANDELVYETTNHLEGADVGAVDGKRRVVFQFRSVSLVEGQYRVTIGLHSTGRREIYDWHDQRYTFDVVRSLEGGVQMPVDVRIEPL